MPIDLKSELIEVRPYQAISSMSRRRGEITWRINEREHPHMVEMAVPPMGFGAALNTMHDWHRQYGVTSKQGANWRDGAGTDYVRWCFADHEIADAFAAR